MLLKKLFCIALISLLFVSEVRAQFLYEQTHAATDWRAIYEFRKLSCWENICTASAFVYDGINKIYNLMFFRSTDDGFSWEIQDPHLQWTNDNRSIQTTIRRIQQIDSLNVVAVGDTGLILRTFDGGLTWERQKSHTLLPIYGVHFSDPQIGIFVVNSTTVINPAGVPTTFTTNDGGLRWYPVSYPFPARGYGIRQCHSYGNGKFRTFFSGIPSMLFTTTNNWVTYTSSEIVNDSLPLSMKDKFFFTDCNFSAGDTIIPYGVSAVSGTGFKGAIMRSVDAGAHWEKPALLDNNVTGMSPFHGDTLIAYDYASANIFISSDRGASWRKDKILLTTNYPVNSTLALDYSTNSPVAALSSNYYSLGASVLARGLPGQSSVWKKSVLSGASTIFPNPGRNEIRIQTTTQSGIISIIDLLGRQALQDFPLANGSVVLNISSLSRGVYTVIINNFGKKEIVGKLVVTDSGE